jgi:tripartite ATP-independent transporter DctM subunit
MLAFTEYLDDFQEKVVTPVSKKIHVLSYIIAGLMPIPIFADVVLRFFFGRSMRGVMEIEEFMLAILVFFSISLIQIKKEQISIDFIFSRFPQRVQLVIEALTTLLSFVLFVLVTRQTILYSIQKIGEFSISLELPVSVFLGLASIGLIVLTVSLLIDFLKLILKVSKERKVIWPILILAAGTLVYMFPVIIKELGWRPSGIALGGMGMAFLFLLMLLRMPLGYAMALTGFLGLAVFHSKLKSALGMLGVAPYSTAASFILVVVPLFILMGELAFTSGISKDLFETANKWLGRMRGGLAMSAVAGCAGFAAVCGDSLATAITMGTVSLPEMKKKKYSDKLATGCLAAGGTLGILIPPSVGFIFYAIVTEESVGKLFIAGLLPGLLLALLFFLAIYIIARMNPDAAPRGEKTSFREKLRSLKGVLGMLLLFILILGGILGGIFSPTEGGGIGAIGAFAFALFKRRVTWKNLKKALTDTVDITCKLLTILIGVGILSYFLAATRLPMQLAEMVTGLDVNRYLIFTAVIILFAILGCLMNVIPMILLTLPSIFPTIVALGFDPIWFGVITVIVMEMGQITPPVGVNVFALGTVATNVRMETIFKGIVPFFICMLVCVGILVLFPQIALFLPGLFFK